MGSSLLRLCRRYDVLNNDPDLIDLSGHTAVAAGIALLLSVCSAHNHWSSSSLMFFIFLLFYKRTTIVC